MPVLRVLLLIVLLILLVSGVYHAVFKTPARLLSREPSAGLVCVAGLYYTETPNGDRFIARDSQGRNMPCQ